MSEMQETSELDTVASEIQQQESAAKEEPKSVIEDILPDEFKGKTPSEIAKQALFYRNQMGKQANELGEVRRLADELIKSQLHKPKEQLSRKLTSLRIRRKQCVGRLSRIQWFNPLHYRQSSPARRWRSNSW